MENEIRKAYNAAFSPEKYEAFKKAVSSKYQHTPKFRLCETPVFIDNRLKAMLIEACEEINEVITRPDFKTLTEGAIKHPSMKVPNEDEHTRFLVLDFGICEDGNGGIIPQLIEVQGFPSLYFFQDLLSHAYKEVYDIPEDRTSYFGGLDSEQYIALLREVIVGDHNPRNVVLLEIEPEKQATSIDFYVAAAHLGIKVLCISKMKKRDKQLFYTNEAGKEVKIERIFNRVIFDELEQRPELERDFDFMDEVDVEWVGHPNWFFRISKFTMPLFSGKYVPECRYLSDVDAYPEDLENYVLKPLYSFAGTGVNLHITAEDLDGVVDRENFILQRKVNYASVIETPTGPAKFEIRMLMIWEKGEPKVKLVNNLVRVSKGEMVGVRYNKDKDWVGASVAFFKA